MLQPVPHGDLNLERSLALTDSLMVGIGSCRSMETCEVHLPVLFDFASIFDDVYQEFTGFIVLYLENVAGYFQQEGF